MTALKMKCVVMSNLKKILCFVLVATSPTLAKAELHPDFYATLIGLINQNDVNSDVLVDWRKNFIQKNNMLQIDTADNCYRKKGGELILILKFEKSGKVIDAVPSHSSEKSECFKKSYVGRFFGKPPLPEYRELLRFR